MPNDAAVSDSKKKSYFNYFSFGLDNYIDRVLVRIRSEVTDSFMELMQPTAESKVLDVGVSAHDHGASNVLEQKYSWLQNLTALGVGDFWSLEEQFPGLRYVKGDGRSLPFEDGAFDFVYSHAVIEHIGMTDLQVRFMGELWRVARKGIFVTTPNRWHPVETHTGLPFLQFLPKSIHLVLFGLLGKHMYSTIDQLNLLGAVDLRRLAAEAGIPDFRIRSIYWLGVPSNLIGYAMRPSSDSAAPQLEAERIDGPTR